MQNKIMIPIILIGLFLAVGCAGPYPAEPPVSDTPAPTASPTSEATSTSRFQTVYVTIQNNAFDPATITISSRDTVVWKNMDSAQHRIKIMGMATDYLDQGDTYKQVFFQGGKYEYSCTIHPAMKGTVIVK